MNNYLDQIETVNVSRETFDEIEWYFVKHYTKLKEYARQIVWWNSKFNLVSRNQSENALLEHIRHSMSLCIAEGFWKAKNIVDAGTGAGLPGLPLSLIHDDAHFTLVDVNQKKITAIKQMVAALNLDRIEAQCVAIEEFESTDKSILISKHAFKLDEFFMLSFKQKFDSYYFLKGDDFKQELTQDLLDKFTIKVYNLETGTYLSFFNHKFLLQLDPK